MTCADVILCSLTVISMACFPSKKPLADLLIALSVCIENGIFLNESHALLCGLLMKQSISIVNESAHQVLFSFYTLHQALHILNEKTQQ